MSKEKAAVGELFGGLFHLGTYKRNQGRIVRQWTCWALWIAFGLCAWRLRQMLVGSQIPQAEFFFPLGLLVFGLWTGFRVVNLPKFADFLIAVEAEMNKVTWPSRTELARSTAVVIFVIFALAVILFGFDALWTFVFERLGIIR